MLSKIFLFWSTLAFFCLMYTSLALTRLRYITRWVSWFTLIITKNTGKKTLLNKWHRGTLLRLGFGKKYRWDFSGLETASGPAFLKRKRFRKALVKYADGLNIHITNSPWQLPLIDHLLAVCAAAQEWMSHGNRISLHPGCLPGPLTTEKESQHCFFWHCESLIKQNSSASTDLISRQHFSWV